MVATSFYVLSTVVPAVDSRAGKDHCILPGHLPAKIAVFWWNAIIFQNALSHTLGLHSFQTETALHTCSYHFTVLIRERIMEKVLDLQSSYFS